jgi:hypothetical protein
VVLGDQVVRNLQRFYLVLGDQVVRNLYVGLNYTLLGLISSLALTSCAANDYMICNFPIFPAQSLMIFVVAAIAIIIRATFVWNIFVPHVK